MVFMYFCVTIHALLEHTKAVIFTTDQDPATEVTHLRLNLPPFFSSVGS